MVSQFKRDEIAFELRHEDNQQPKRQLSARSYQSSDRVWPAETVWAAAAYAHRLNGGEYRKETEYRVNENGTLTHDVVRDRNRDIMHCALKDTTVITEADRELGRRARDWHSKNLVIKTLKSSLTDFELSLQKATAIDDFSENAHRLEMAVVASQIRGYEQAQLVEEVMDGINADPIAAIGDKISTDITVIKSVYSQNFNVYFITAVTPDRHAVFFSYRERLANGHQCHIRGTVKAHRENSTQLNRVRMV